VSSVQPAQTNESTANVLVDTDSSSPFQTQLCGVHGRRKDFFQGGPLGHFSKIFLGGGNTVKFVFSHLKLRKQPFLVKFSKSRMPFPPSGAHGWVNIDNEIYAPIQQNAVTDDRKYSFVVNSYTASLEKGFKIDANEARGFTGHFLVV